MAKHILQCTKCRNYTMKDKCEACNIPTIKPKPPKYSPEDKYGKFRRETKEQEYKDKDLL